MRICVVKNKMLKCYNVLKCYININKNIFWIYIYELIMNVKAPSIEIRANTV
jgi:hypothetical protein